MPTPPLSVHPHQQEPGPTTPQHQENVVHYPQLTKDTPLVHTEHHESPPQSPTRHQQKHEFHVEVETSEKPKTKKQPQVKRELETRKLLPGHAAGILGTIIRIDNPFTLHLVIMASHAGSLAATPTTPFDTGDPWGTSISQLADRLLLDRPFMLHLAHNDFL